MLERIVGWLDTLERIITAFTAAILGLLALLIGWQVVARYFLHSGQFWADELTLIGIMWGTMMGAAACVWTDSHVSLTFLLSKLPKTPGLWVRIVLDAIVFGFALVIVWEGLTLAQKTMSGKMAAIGISIGVTYSILPVSGALMAIFVLVKSLVRIADHFRTNKGGL